MARGKTKQKGKGSKGQNRKNTNQYFDKMKAKAEYTETESGMLYEVLQLADEPHGKSMGSGPKKTDTVTVNQRISLIDGTIIADTYKGVPDTFPIKEAIQGYQEGLMMMKEGARYKFIIPPELGWGKRGAGDKIGPDATLIIDVRLEKIES